MRARSAIFLRSRPLIRFDLFASRIPRKPGRTGVSNEKYRAMILDDDRGEEKEAKGGRARGERGCKVFIYRATETV